MEGHRTAEALNRSVRVRQRRRGAAVQDEPRGEPGSVAATWTACSPPRLSPTSESTPGRRQRKSALIALALIVAVLLIALL
jgi:hypothetical protein